MSWQLTIFVILAVVLLTGFVWFERSRPSARIVAAVAALAALGVAGRLALAPIPNVVATTDVALLAGYTLGGGPGFAVGALSAVVSNFWLGQGPWTPWQMAGWGMVGIGGALLARFCGHSLNRWWLAAAAALAGLLYGVLLDLSVMVGYGGEQSLDRYLALSARGVPFNVAHAVGNAALMVIAGPALVRMLDRYRGRFEVEWRTPAVARLGAPLAALALAAGIFGGGAIGGATQDASGASGSKSAARWMAGAQNSDGGFGISPGASSSTGMTGWAMLGLEAAGVNPLDVRNGGRSPVDYLRSNVGALDSTADLERTILALEAAGVDSRGFGGRNLVNELRKRQGSDGSYEKQVNLTAFAVLAQRAAGISGSKFGKPSAWLRKTQNRNGGWGSVNDAESEPDSTGAAMQALAIAPGGGNEMADGARWLAKAQRRDGGWSLTAGAPTNTQSTAWAIQGTRASGRSPGSKALSYLGSRRQSDGHYTYSSSSDQTPVWVTAQAMAGAEQAAYPLAAVQRRAGSGGGGGDGSGSPGSGSGEDGTDVGAGKRNVGSGAARKKASKRAERKDAREAGGRGATDDDEPSIEDELMTVDNEPASAAGQSPLPGSTVMLAGLGGLGALLGLSFLWYRRRLR